MVRRRVAHGYWFHLISVLLCVDGDAGELQTLVLMYRSYFLKPASALCSWLRYVLQQPTSTYSFTKA